MSNAAKNFDILTTERFT